MTHGNIGTQEVLPLVSLFWKGSDSSSCVAGLEDFRGQVTLSDTSNDAWHKGYLPLGLGQGEALHAPAKMGTEPLFFCFPAWSPLHKRRSPESTSLKWDYFLHPGNLVPWFFLECFFHASSWINYFRTQYFGPGVCLLSPAPKYSFL